MTRPFWNQYFSIFKLRDSPTPVTPVTVSSPSNLSGKSVSSSATSSPLIPRGLTILAIATRSSIADALVLDQVELKAMVGFLPGDEQDAANGLYRAALAANDTSHIAFADPDLEPN